MDALGRVTYDDHPVLTAEQLDQVVKRATFNRKLKRPPVPEEAENGYRLYFEQNEDGDALENGDMAIGCTMVPYALLLRAHRLSLAARKRRKK